ncbi:hypothetical protein SprV_0200536200 [Sparganum proliferum]
MVVVVVTRGGGGGGGGGGTRVSASHLVAMGWVHFAEGAERGPRDRGGRCGSKATCIRPDLFGVGTRSGNLSTTATLIPSPPPDHPSQLSILPPTRQARPALRKQPPRLFVVCFYYCQSTVRGRASSKRLPTSYYPWNP